MKILQVIDKLDVGGAEKVLVDLSNMLSENCVNSSVLCLLEESVLDSKLLGTIPIYYLRRKNKFNLSRLISLFNLLKNYDIVHVHSRHVLRYVGLLLFLPKMLRPFRIVYQDHSLLGLEDGFKGKYYFNLLLKKVDAVIVVSEAQIKFFPKNIACFLLESTIRKTDIKINIPPQRKRLVAIGNFRRIKNYSFLLELLQNLPKEFTCDIYTSHIDEPYFEENKTVIDKLILEEKLNIIVGKLEIQSQLINYSLAIHTSLSESGPLIAIECLSVGLPILMFNTGAVAPHIKKCIPDLIKENTNLEQWTQTIIGYHSNAKMMEQYSTALYKLYLETYSEEKYLKKCLKIYTHFQSS